MDATKLLLRAGANPLLTYTNPSGEVFVPLDEAALNGHLEVVRELVQEHGIKGCGGACGGVNALRAAAQRQYLEIMSVLTNAGVVDTGIALITAVDCGRESSVKFLLQRKAGGQGAGYPNYRIRFGATPLVCSMRACRSCSPRVARLLIDAGADTTSAVRLSDREGTEIFNDTPLALANSYLDDEKLTDDEVHSLEAIRRLLMRVEAIHAVSWLWSCHVPSDTNAAAAEGTGRRATTTTTTTTTTSTPLASMLPILRRRTQRPRVLMAAMFRWVARHLPSGGDPALLS